MEKLLKQPHVEHLRRWWHQKSRLNQHGNLHSEFMIHAKHFLDVGGIRKSGGVLGAQIFGRLYLLGACRAPPVFSPPQLHQAHMQIKRGDKGISTS